MGVEKFFSTINRNFNVMKTIEMGNNETNINASYLMFDFNSDISKIFSNIGAFAL